jgi:hypothetical protein
MFHAAALALDDVSRGVSRSSLSRSLTRDRGLGPARWGPRSRPVRNDGARRGGAVRAQVFTVLSSWKREAPVGKTDQSLARPRTRQ